MGISATGLHQFRNRSTRPRTGLLRRYDPQQQGEPAIVEVLTGFKKKTNKQKKKESCRNTFGGVLSRVLGLGKFRFCSSSSK